MVYVNPTRPVQPFDWMVPAKLVGVILLFLLFALMQVVAAIAIGCFAAWVGAEAVCDGVSALCNPGRKMHLF